VVLRANGVALDDDDARVLERLDAIVERALERTPQARFATAREMALALERDVGCASPAEVANWVEHLASDRLRDRDEKVAALERDVVERRRVDDLASVPPRGADPRRRTVALALAALGAILVFVVVGRLSRGERSSANVAMDLPKALASAPAEPSAALPSSAVVEPPSPVASTHATRAPRRRTVVVSASAHSSAPLCDPPFSLDEAGRKVFKEECLQ
jgi:hypothetical protein